MTLVLDTLTSAVFAAAVVALLRKRWPAIDGWYVTAVYAALALVSALLTHYSARIPAEVWTALQVLASIVTVQGGVTLTQQIAGKSRSINVLPVTASDPVVRDKLDRDTDRME